MILVEIDLKKIVSEFAGETNSESSPEAEGVIKEHEIVCSMNIHPSLGL